MRSTVGTIAQPYLICICIHILCDSRSRFVLRRILYCIPILARFLETEVPPSNFIEVGQADIIKSLKRTQAPNKLEDACHRFDIHVKLKHRMNDKAETCKTR